jgi:hypothetical protein
VETFSQHLRVPCRRPLRMAQLQASEGVATGLLCEARLPFICRDALAVVFRLGDVRRLSHRNRQARSEQQDRYFCSSRWSRSRRLPTITDAQPNNADTHTRTNLTEADYDPGNGEDILVPERLQGRTFQSDRCDFPTAVASGDRHRRRHAYPGAVRLSSHLSPRWSAGCRSSNRNPR